MQQYAAIYTSTNQRARTAARSAPMKSRGGCDCCASLVFSMRLGMGWACFMSSTSCALNLRAGDAVHQHLDVVVRLMACLLHACAECLRTR
jgi:hypothetical protein